MTGITLAICIAGAIAVLWFRPGLALGTMIMVMIIYPDYLRLEMGPVQMSAGRFIGIVLLAKRILAGGTRGIRWCAIDFLVPAWWVWSIVANAMAGATAAHMTWTIGNGLDTVMMYFVARLCLQREENYKDLVVPLAITGIFMAIMGAMEAITFHSPYQELMKYHQWMWMWKPPEFRMGMLRAQASLSHPITFGMVMFLVTGILFSIRGYAKHAWVCWTGVVGGTVATASSLSSGPQMSLMAFIISALFYLRPSLIKPALVVLVIMCVLAEFSSNRHFYDLIDYVNISGGGGWYRNRLIEVAVAQLHEYWAFGFAGEWPMHWGALIDGRKHVDVVNHYIVTAIYAGLPATVMLLACQILGIRECVRTWRAADPAMRKLVFGLACTMLGLMFGLMSVGLYSTPVMLMYILLASMIQRRGMTTSRTRITNSCVAIASNFEGEHKSHRSYSSTCVCRQI